MISEIAPFIASFCGGLLGYFTGKFTLGRRVLQLEIRQDDLEERHLTNARRSAARARWDSDDQIDQKLDEALGMKLMPEKKGWTKWGSSKNSKLEKSPEQP